MHSEHWESATVGDVSLGNDFEDAEGNRLTVVFTTKPLPPGTRHCLVALGKTFAQGTYHNISKDVACKRLVRIYW